MELEKVFNNNRKEKLYQRIATAISNYYDGQILECDIDCIAAGIVERLILENGEHKAD